MGLVSGITQPIANWQQRKAQYQGAKALNKEMQLGYDAADAQGLNTYNALSSMFTPIIQSGDQARLQYLAQSNPEAYNQYLAQNGFDLSQNWMNTPGALQGTGLSGNMGSDIQRFLDPSMQFRMEQGIKGMDASAASKGGLYSGGYGKELQRYSQGLASEEYGKSFERMQDVKKGAYQNWQDRLTALQNTRQQQMSQLNNIMQGGNQMTTNLGTARQAYGDNLATNAFGRHQSQGQTDAARKLSGWNSGDTWGLIGGIGDAAITGGMMYATGGLGAPAAAAVDAGQMAMGGASPDRASSYAAMGLPRADMSQLQPTNYQYYNDLETPLGSPIGQNYVASQGMSGYNPSIARSGYFGQPASGGYSNQETINSYGNATPYRTPRPSSFGY